jgi:hypothetical protein
MYAIVSAAALGAVTGRPLVDAVFGLGAHRQMTGVTISTALLSAVLVAFVTLQKGHRSPLFAMLVALPLGALNAGLSLAINEALDGNMQAVPSSLIMGTLFGVALGAPLGLVYAVALALPCYLVTKVRNVVGPGAGLKARLPFAVLLLVATALAPARHTLARDIGASVALLGFALCAVDVFRWRHLRGRLRAGLRPGIEAMPLGAFLESAEVLLPTETAWRAAGLGAYDRRSDVLLACDAASTPFRDMSRAQPIAVLGDWGGAVLCDVQVLRASGR